MLSTEAGSEVLILLDIMRKPNSIIVLLYIQKIERKQISIKDRKKAILFTLLKITEVRSKKVLLHADGVSS